MSVTLAQIIDAIESKLSAATTLARSESYDELTEGIHELPMLQVFPESIEQDSRHPNDRTSFGADIRQTHYVINADYYAAQRVSLGQDMAALVDGVDAITDVLENEKTKPLFGLEGIQSYHWSGQRVTFTYTDPNIKFTGMRFTITVEVF